MPAVAAEITGLLSLAGLLLLPGLLIVRAPWTYVPFLSASFWIASVWWVDLAGASRLRFLWAALACFTILGSLRLLRLGRPSVPAWPAALVAACACARLAPYFMWPVAPGADMSLHSLSTLLMVWRDGVPKTYEPLLPISTFGAYTPGLHGLAADVSLLSGLPAYRSAFLAGVAAYGLLQIALYALLLRSFDRRVAALASVLALGMARAPQSFFGWGGNPSVLALAMLTAAAALLASGRSRAPAVAAGLMLAAAVVSHAMMAAAAAAALLPWVAYLWWSAAPTERPAVVARFALAGGVALAAAAPFLLQLDFTLSAGERGWLADHLRTHYAADWARYSRIYLLAVVRYGIATLNDGFWCAALTGAAVAARRRAPGLPATAAGVALLLVLAASARWGGLGPLVFFPERPLAVAMVLLSPGIAFLVHALLVRRDRARHQGRSGLARVGPILVLVVLAAVAVERTQRYYLAGARTVMLATDDLAAMSWIREHTQPLDLICNDYGTPGMWVGALAGRAASAPQLPPFYFDEFRRGIEGRHCGYRYVSERRFFGARRAPQPTQGLVVFENASVRILTSFDTERRNLPEPEP